MKPRQRRINIHVILLAVCMLMLLLPLGGLHFMKLYESALIRQTESELIAQAAFIGATYKQAVARHLPKQDIANQDYGLPLPLNSEMRKPLQPISVHLDLARDRLNPPRPDGESPNLPADPISVEAGQDIIPVLQDAQRTTLSGIKVLNTEGITVAGHSELGLSFLDLPEVQNALHGKPVSLLRQRLRTGTPHLSSISRDAEMNVFVAAPIVLDGRVIGVAYVNRTPMDLVKVLYSKKRDIAMAVVLALLATLGLAVFTSYTITRPIHALIRQARQITAGSKEAIRPIAHPVTAEIALLSESMAEMARTIQHRSAYIRNFATSVSHEFKTPLTAIQGSTELLQEHWDSMPPAQRNRFLSNIGEDTDRLRRLVTRLLELARAEMLEPVEASTTSVLSLLAALAERYRERGLTATIRNETGETNLLAAIPQEVLETALTTLWDNSLQQNATQSEVILRRNADGLEMIVGDNGSGISESNRHQIFTPFFTTERDKGGTGLGLSISRQLLAVYEAQIMLLPDAPGAHFRITLVEAATSNA